jgi:carbamoyl-phosphate synthase small subunit
VKKMQKAKGVRLVLEDGTVLKGKSFGYEKSIAGEVVFYTAMTGYPESLTDPSYAGQLLVSTFPLIGNYGVPSDVQENGICRFYESHKIHVSGLLIADYAFAYSHWNAVKSLGAWLQEHQKPGVFDIDTRALTKILREKGSMLGKIEFDDPVDFYDPNKKNLVAQVSINQQKTYGNGKYKVVLIDCGVKYNIIRSLLKRNATVIRIPWNEKFADKEYDGVFISNGPGDPAMCNITVQHIRKAMEQNKPIMGICLGNQLLARAAGAETYKLKYGHRSHNQPVLLTGTNRCFITAQNHGFAIRKDTLPTDWEEMFVNVNDQTNEGIRHKHKPFFSIQFHPEAASGPLDTDFLFDEFISNMEQAYIKKTSKVQAS